MLTVSIVSHGHGPMTEAVLADLVACPEVDRVVLTLNVPEPMLKIPVALQSKSVVINNPSPKGFAANHNAAYKHCGSEYFCVLNPDIHLRGNPFPVLIEVLAASSAAMAAPLVVNSHGAIEDSVRYFPTPWRLLKKALCNARGSYVIVPGGCSLAPDWVAGMFMLFDSAAFRQLRGFDEGFHLYYEDADICVRIWKLHLELIVCTNVTVTHDAQRASHRSLRFLRWHLMSMLRFFIKHLGRLPTPDTRVGRS